MTVEFKSNPMYDLAILSGFEPNLEPVFAMQVSQTKKVTKQFKKSYEAYKQNLLKTEGQNYGQFLKKVEVSLLGLQDCATETEAREKISAKLEALALVRIKEEATLKPARLFFHRIGHFLRGHGFKTKGEWGLKLV